MGTVNMKGADYAVVEAWIGGFEVHSTEDHTLGIEVERNCKGMAMQAILNLYDDTALEIETLISSGARDVKFRYGWTDRLGPMYKGSISKAHVQFRGNSGATLRLEITAPTIVEATNPHKSKTYKDMKLEAIFSDVAKEEGWEVVYITTCDVVPDPFKDGDMKPYQRENESGQDFVRKVIKDAVKTGHGTVTAYWGWNPETNKLKFMVKALDEEGSVEDIYYVGGEDERVIAWEPVRDEAVPNLLGASNIKCEGLDLTRHEYFKVESQATMKNGAFKISRIYPASASSSGQVEKALTHMWKAAQERWCKANLTITGSPRWNPTDNIEVIAYTKHGVVHHSSGIYQIQKGRDVISNGGFTSVLELLAVRLRSGDIFGSPSVKSSGQTDSGSEKVVDGNVVPKPAPASSATASNGSSRGVESSVSFPVSSPKIGDIVIATRKVNGVPVANRAIYLDNRYVKVCEGEGQRVVSYSQFTSGCTLEYRRQI